MKIEVEKIQNEFSRDLYWTRIHFTSDDEVKKTTVLVCTSLEYLWDYFGTKDFTDTQKDEWLYSVVEEWRSRGISIFNDAVHYAIFAKTEEGENNGIDFLRKEVLP